jgi:hypothetical protein
LRSSLNFELLRSWRSAPEQVEKMEKCCEGFWGGVVEGFWGSRGVVVAILSQDMTHGLYVATPSQDTTHLRSNRNTVSIAILSQHSLTCDSIAIYCLLACEPIAAWFTCDSIASKLCSSLRFHRSSSKSLHHGFVLVHMQSQPRGIILRSYRITARLTAIVEAIESHPHRP